MIKVKVPGSCGELVQGTVDGCNFLITCPIDVYSQASVIAGSPAGEIAYGSKVQEAIEKTLEYLQLDKDDHNFYISVKTGLPVGKGMASSSADLGAVIQALALHFGRLLRPDEIADIALSIEPTDAVFFPGITMFDHLYGKVRRYLGSPPEITIAVFDTGGEVDTLSFNKRSDLVRLNRAKSLQVRQAMDFVQRGIKTGDARLIGRGATLSARANQNILYKHHLETFIHIGGKFGAVGVNIAHSGTILGILFEANYQMKCEECAHAVQTLCPDVYYLGTVNLISGGSFSWKGDTHGWKPCF